MKFFFGVPGGMEHETILTLEPGELQDFLLQTAVEVLDFCRKNPPTGRLGGPWAEITEAKTAYFDEATILAVFQVKVKLLYDFVSRAYMAPDLGQWYPGQAKLLVQALGAYQAWRDEFFRNGRTEHEASWLSFPFRHQNWTNFNQKFLRMFGP